MKWFFYFDFEDIIQFREAWIRAHIEGNSGLYCRRVGTGQLAMHDEQNASFILIWKILSSFVKPGSRHALSTILYFRVGSLPCMMKKWFFYFDLEDIIQFRKAQDPGSR